VRRSVGGSKRGDEHEETLVIAAPVALQLLNNEEAIQEKKETLVIAAREGKK
jgi:uncharacterized protein YfaP (DUF2135 family)